MKTRSILGVWTLALACAAGAILIIATSDHTNGKLALILLAVPIELAFVAANDAFYASARGPKEVWEVPGSKHMGGAESQQLEYERRIVGFFDRALLGGRAR